MNKEEKKAIEDMNRFANGIDMSCVTARQMQIILNLIEKLQEENKEKDKIIDLLIKELYTKAHISTRCYLQTSTEECMKYKNCYECLKKHFENKERRNNGKGN